MRSSPRWARRTRAALLAAIGLLYVLSIPWYRSEGPSGRLLGLPDWVSVALLCYVAVALLNCAAWLLTEVRDEVPDDVRDPDEPDRREGAP